MGAAVRNIMPQRGSQLLAVVGEDLRVVCAARDGDVGHAVVEQVFGPQLGIDVDQLSGVNYSFRSTTTIIPDSCWNFVLSSPC